MYTKIGDTIAPQPILTKIFDGLKYQIECCVHYTILSEFYFAESSHKKQQLPTHPWDTEFNTIESFVSINDQQVFHTPVNV